MPPRRPHWREWVLPVVWVLAGFGAQVCVWLLPRSTPAELRIGLGASLGLLFGSAFIHLMQVAQRERLWRACRQLPASITVEQQDDGTIVAFVTRVDGEPAIVTLPEGYDPREDGGKQMMELIVGQTFE